ncbi:MAG: tetraacyldisaccharide 4'-kinase [bacterium]
MRSYLYTIATGKSKGFIPAIIKLLLLPLSLIYGLVVRFLAFFYTLRSYRLPCKVISIGNITLGGTGKTVLVEFVSRYLKEKGHKVAILSRGYKRSDACSLGDEPYMLKRQLEDIPVIVNPDRIKAAEEAVRDYGVDTVVLDDGFQQWRIKKDLEIVLVDATEPFGNGRLLPAGILRQPLSALRQADILFLSKVDLSPGYLKAKDFLSRINPGALIFESIHKPLGFYGLGNNQELFRPEAFKAETVALISGIGSPDSFEGLIKGLGINIGLSFRFPDHHHYSEEELRGLIRQAKEKNITKIITTEKDAVRIISLGPVDYGLPIFVLRIALKIIENEEGFCNRLLKLYSF